METLKFCSLVVVSFIFSTSLALANDTHGIFMVVKGDIKVTSKDGKTEPAKVGKKVFPGDAIAAGADSRAKVVMSDKNVLNVSPDSKIVIEKYENNGADKKNVELNVLYGKVRASVEQKYDGEKSKFNIKTPSAVAGVRGTDFITGYNPTTKVSQVITFSGVVAVGTAGPNGSISNPVFVRPGQMTSTSAGQAPQAPTAVPTEELKTMNTDSVSANDAGGPDAPAVASGGTAEPAKKEDGGRAPASESSSTAAAPAASAPSMIDNKDLGPEASKSIPVASGPENKPPPPAYIPPQPKQPDIPKPPPEALRGKARISITIGR